jgi:electron transfer flavoprotein beta subunit
VSDAINEPRYPSLKGIMSAKKKPQETLVRFRSRPRCRARWRAGLGTSVLALGYPPPRGDARKIEDDGSAAARSPTSSWR